MQRRGPAGQRVVLRGPVGLAVGYTLHCPFEQAGRKIGQRCAQFSTVGLSADRYFLGQQHVALVEPGVDPHDAHPAFAAALKYGALYGRGSTQVGEQRGVGVDAAQPWQFEQGGRQYPAVGHHHAEVGAQVAEPGVDAGVGRVGGL